MDLVMALIDNAGRWARRQLAPVTVGLMAALVVTSLFFWFTQGKFQSSLYMSNDLLNRPWTVLTYVFADMFLGNVNQLIWLVILMGWMLLSCASVERTIGVPKYAALWVVTSIVPALCYGIGANILQKPIELAGPFFPIAAISFIWALNNKSFSLYLFFIPISGLVLCYLIPLGILFGYGMGAPMLGLFACLYLIPAYFYAENKIPFLLYEIAATRTTSPPRSRRRKRPTTSPKSTNANKNAPNASGYGSFLKAVWTTIRSSPREQALHRRLPVALQRGVRCKSDPFLLLGDSATNLPNDAKPSRGGGRVGMEVPGNL
jgi:hypothetical protein